MARGQKQDPSVKAAVMAALLTGQGVDTVAKAFGVPASTVKTWKKGIDGKRSEPIQVGKLPQSTLEALGEVENISYQDLVDRCLTEALITLAEQQRLFRNPDWIKRMNAADMAVLHGVTWDKVYRTIQAKEAALGDDEEDDANEEE